MNYNELNFEKFTGMGSKVSRKISITRSYSFGIPPAFFKENDIDNYNHVVIFYEKNAGVIGLNFNNAAEGFKLVKYGTGDKRGASFVARSFFNAYGLDSSKCKGRYSVEKIDKEGVGHMYIIDINKKEQENKK